MPIPTTELPLQAFPQLPASVPSFSLTDYITGTGYIRHYAAGINVNEADVDFILTPNVIYATDDDTAVAIGTGIGRRTFITSSEGLANINFDLVFNRTVTLNGDCFITTPISLSNSSGTPNVGVLLTIKLHHFDGTTETQLGDTEVSAIKRNSVNTTTSYYFVMTNRIKITNQIFRPNDRLRLEVNFAANGNGGDMEFGHDPKSRTDTFLNKDSGASTPATTALTVDIPFNSE